MAKRKTNTPVNQIRGIQEGFVHMPILRAQGARSNKKNIFYHFTRMDAAHQIKREGLTKGVTTVKDKDQTGFLKHTQWLTTVAEQSDQQWTDGYKSRFGVSRTEARVKINIPTPFMGNVMEFQEFCKLFKEHLPYKFDAYPELSKGWYVYLGDIPKAWIVNIRFYQE